MYLADIPRDATAYWTGGETGSLMIHRCSECLGYFHPPLPACPSCTSPDVVPTKVSGKGRIHAFTVNFQSWSEDSETPFLFAAIELVEQQDLFVTARVIDCPFEAVYVGMAVEVEFRKDGELWIPLFRPSENDVSGGTAGGA